MISYERSGWYQRPWFLAAAAGILIGLSYWFWEARADASAQGAGVSDGHSLRGLEAHMAQTGSEVPSALLVPPSLMPDGRPSDFSAEDWRALKDAASTADSPQMELDRLVAYLRFQKGFSQWQSLRDGSDVGMRHQLAQRLLDQVPDRLKQGEITSGEAVMLQQALLGDIEPDETLRKQKFELLSAELKAVAPQPDPKQQADESARLAEYKRREAAIVADYQAKPEHDRSQVKLEEALEAARVAVYGGKN